MEILLWKKTKDSDLKVGLQVCYHDLNGAYTKLGTITDIIEQDGVKLYLLNTAMGAYMADELKLIKQPKLSFNDWFPTWHKAASYEYWSQSQGTGLKRAHELMRQAGIEFTISMTGLKHKRFMIYFQDKTIIKLYATQ